MKKILLIILVIISLPIILFIYCALILAGQTDKNISKNK
jgi:hypothetical protein